MNLSLDLLSLCAIQELARVIDRELQWVAESRVPPTTRQLENLEWAIHAINHQWESRMVAGVRKELL